jgi:hypothetical protein
MRPCVTFCALSVDATNKDKKIKEQDFMFRKICV